MKPLPKEKRVRRENAGFTLVELMITIAIIGVLAAISMPAMSAYMARADYAALKLTLDCMMDGEDMYFAENGRFYPPSGTVRVPKGVAKVIPEIACAFSSGHKNSYQIYGYNYNAGGRSYNYCYVYVTADFDANNNGYNDIFMMLTYYYNDRVLYNRQLFQLR